MTLPHLHQEPDQHESHHAEPPHNESSHDESSGYEHHHHELPVSWRAESVISVQHRIAHAFIHGNAANHCNHQARDYAVLGKIRLLEHQRDAVARVSSAIAFSGGALLADEVGLGKTFVALAIARAYKRVTLLAPAALLRMWRDAMVATETSHVTVKSLQSLSRVPAAAPIPTSPRAAVPAPHSNQNDRDLIIVDEAHYLRTRTTRRYARAADICAGNDVLLLTATPLHNNASELRALLALFMGERADVLDSQMLAALIVRRTHNQISAAPLPNVVEHAPLAVPENPPVLEALLSLPPPVPTHNGGAAGALIRLGLLRAWCSSDAALSDTVRNRRMRGEALLHALAHGRHPTRAELRTWTTGSDSIQLGFPELLVSNTLDSASTSGEGMLSQVTTHLNALEHLERLHIRTATADASRGALLREMLKVQPHTPILAFSQFASTVNALFRALSDVAGVASLTSSGGRIAGGALQRNEVISRFAPRAHERPPPPAHESIKLLLTTDLLSEGVNLQDAGRLIHLDLPWTAAARAQRVGRLVRMGSLHGEIHVHSIAPPPGTQRTFGIVATLARKARISRELVGHDSLDVRIQNGNESVTESVAHNGAEPDHTRALDNANAEGVPSAADDATKLRRTFSTWLDDERNHDGTLGTATATVAAAQDGWLAVVNNGSAIMVWSCVNNVFRDDPSGILHAVECMRAPITSSLHSHYFNTHSHLADDTNDKISAAIVAVQTRIADSNIAALTGPPPTAMSDVQQRLLRHISQIVATSTPARRTRLSVKANDAERTVLSARGVGAEWRLAHWLLARDTDSGETWLDRWRDDPELTSVAHRETVKAKSQNGARGDDLNPHDSSTIIALLLLVPDA